MLLTFDVSGACAPHKNTRFECQLYSPSDFAGECASVCYKASRIPVECAQQEIRKSRHPVTRRDWTGMSNDSIIEYDDDEIEDFSTLGFNEFKTNDNLNEGTTVAKIVDPYGVGKYTSDGKHYYDNEYDAAHSQEGLSHIGHKVSGAWDNFKGFFSLKTKFKDKDKELQREIAREVNCNRLHIYSFKSIVVIHN